MKVFPEFKLLAMPYRADVENILTKAVAQRYEADGAWWLAVPHTLDTVKLLRNMGENPPGPVQYYYDWAGGKPFESQQVTADLLTCNSRAYVLSEMGVGKSRAAAWAYDYLRREGRAHSLLVVAPLSTLVTVWQNELFENFPHLTTAVLYGDRARRRKLLANPADVYIINHEGVKVLHRELFDASRIDAVIVDELAVYRNARSDRWKYLKPIVARAAYAWGLTGSPTPNEPTDAYGQAKLLTPDRVGFSFQNFRSQTMRQLSAFKWIPKEDANEIVLRTLQPSIRFTRDQCFDLPPTTYSTRQVEPSGAAAVAYKEMCEELALQIKTHQVTAANEGVKLSKLLQISCGFVYDSDGQAHYMGGVNRFREIFNLIEESEGKVIVFGPFRYYVEILNAALSKRYRTAMIHGDVPKGQRDVIFTQFKGDPNLRVLVAHPKTMAHGLTLTEANTIIWAAPTTSLEIYEQANARITRSGQTRNTFIIHIQSTKAEQQVYSRLRRKAKTQGVLLDMFEELSGA